MKDDNDLIVFNIMYSKDPKEIKNKLKTIYIKVVQRVIYIILQKFLHYLKITKSKRYEKPVIQIFIKVKYFYKYF